MRYVSKNLNGISGAGKFTSCLHAMKVEHARSPVAAFFVQEHNLPESKKAHFHAVARTQYRILWLARYRPAADPLAGHGHGTAIAIPYDQIVLKEGETLHDAVNRIVKSLTGSKDGRVTSVTTWLEGKPLRLVSAYAPGGVTSHTRPGPRLLH